MRNRARDLLSAVLDGPNDRSAQKALAEYVGAHSDDVLDIADTIRTHTALALLLDSRRQPLPEKVMSALRFGESGEVFAKSVSEAIHQEEKTSAGRRRRRRWPALRVRAPFVAAAGIAAAIAAVWLTMGEENGRKKAQKVGVVIAKVEAASGQWTVDSGQYGKKALKVGDAVRAGDRVETGKGGRVRLAYVGDPASSVAEAMEDASPDGLRRGKGKTSVELGSNAECRMSKRSGDPDGSGRNAEWLELKKGKLTAYVEKRSAFDGVFAVLTPHAKMMVTGTAFSLFVSDAQSRLEVEEGVVRMRALAGGEWHNVGKGRWAAAKAGEGRLLAPGRLLGRVRVGWSPLNLHEEFLAGITFDGASVWILGGAGRTLYEIDCQEERVLRTTLIDAALARQADIAWDGTLVWGADSMDMRMLRGIDPADGRTAKTLRLPEEVGIPWPTHPRHLAFDIGAGALWVGYKGSLFKINLGDGSIERQTELDLGQHQVFSSLAVSEGSIYAMLKYGNRALKIGLEDNRILGSFRTEQKIAGWLSRSAGGNLWILNSSSKQMSLVEADRKILKAKGD